ncbi:MAG: hypothetical protein ABSF21_00810 [Dehalococcoidia bacterium]
MDIQKELDDAKQRRQETVNQINGLAEQKQQLENQRQSLLAEALRLDGEVRFLERLSKDGDKPKE